jgi:hypothetical protein
MRLLPPEMREGYRTHPEESLKMKAFSGGLWGLRLALEERDQRTAHNVSRRSTANRTSEEERTRN